MAILVYDFSFTWMQVYFIEVTIFLKYIIWDLLYSLQLLSLMTHTIWIGLKLLFVEFAWV